MAKPRLHPDVVREYAFRIIDHLRFHSTRFPTPCYYQFQLPDDTLLMAQDDILPSRRQLLFWVATRNSPALAVSSLWQYPSNGGWFADPAWFRDPLPREAVRAARRIGAAIEYAHRNREINRGRKAWAVAVDLSGPPTPLPPPAPLETRTRGAWLQESDPRR